MNKYSAPLPYRDWTDFLWPFRQYNGEQTPQSKALEQAKPQRPVRDDLNDFEEATW